VTRADLGPELFGAAQRFLVDFLAYRAHERLVITTDTARAPGVVEAIQAAALCIGGRPMVLTLPQLPFQGKLADPFLPEGLAGAVGQCDLWIDVTYPYIAGSSLHATAMKGGTLRYMLASDLSAAALVRLFAPDVLDEIYPPQFAFESLIAKSAGSSMRITTPLGTDVRFKLAESFERSPRRASEPGLHFLPGSCLINPDIESVRGRIVLETVFHEFYTPLRTPIELEVDGRIRSVWGGGTERATLERALLRAGGGQFGYVIHFAHGIHPRARYTGNCFVEDMRVLGSNAIGMGLPFWLPEGGENHPDGVISMHSIWLDDVQIVDEGCVKVPH
jgi:2,5-dihydroxypyridine 5,6-dioxygenase